MKKLCCILLLICTFFSVYPFGKKEKIYTPGAEWQGIEESYLFGKAEKAGKNGIVITTPAGDESAAYSLEAAGYSSAGIEAEIVKAAGSYVFIKCLKKTGAVTGDDDSAAGSLFIKEVLLVQDSSEPDWGSARIMEFEGLVEPGAGNMISVTANWESRSRVSHNVYGIFGKKLEKLMGKIIKVEGFIIENPHKENLWSKKILVVKIISQ